MCCERRKRLCWSSVRDRKGQVPVKISAGNGGMASGLLVASVRIAWLLLVLGAAAGIFFFLTS